MLLFASCLGLISCGGEETIIIGSINSHDSSSWFSEEELAKVGLSGLSAPTGCKGAISTSTSWFNDGYSFSEPCDDVSALESNAETYFVYFQTNYSGRFGVTKLYATGNDVVYYRIKADSNLSTYRDDNPSPLYKFYYVRDVTLGEDNYLKNDAVWSMDVRYETNSSGEYMLKIFIENESKSHNGAFTYKYLI